MEKGRSPDALRYPLPLTHWPFTEALKGVLAIQGYTNLLLIYIEASY